MTEQEKKGLLENVINLLEGIHNNTAIDTDPQKTLIEGLNKVFSDNRLNRTRLNYAIEKLNELKLNLNLPQ